MSDSDNSDSEEYEGFTLDKPENRRVINKVVSKLDVILSKDDSNLLLEKLEAIVAKKKLLDAERQKESLQSLE